MSFFFYFLGFISILFGVAIIFTALGQANPAYVIAGFAVTGMGIIAFNESLHQ